jgi:predicted nucleic acid-binding Zn ribbon protein
MRPAIDYSLAHRNCAACGEPFVMTGPDHRYCSRAECKRERQRRPRVSPYVGLSTGQVGAIAELLVSADLLAQGYEVFRAVSPAASCDLIALRGDQILRVEVRTRGRKVDGSISHSRPPSDAGRQDLYAYVTHDREIVYEPVS